MRQNDAKSIAIGGMMAAVAIVIMCLGGIIPIATYVCPMLGAILLAIVVRLCGKRIGWAWYAAVALLSLLLGPDKEAAIVFVFLGYYPILKPKLVTLPLKWLWKVLLFNAAILLVYTLLIHLFGMAQVMDEFAEMGKVMTTVTLLLGNVTFFLLDRLLNLRFKI